MSLELVTHWVSSCNTVSEMKWKSKHVTSCSVISPLIKPVSEITLRVTTARFLHLTVSHQTPIGRQANKRLNSLIDRWFFSCLTFGHPVRLSRHGDRWIPAWGHCTGIKEAIYVPFRLPSTGDTNQWKQIPQFYSDQSNIGLHLLWWELRDPAERKNWY